MFLLTWLGASRDRWRYQGITYIPAALLLSFGPPEGTHAALAFVACGVFRGLLPALSRGRRCRHLAEASRGASLDLPGHSPQPRGVPDLGLRRLLEGLRH